MKELDFELQSIEVKGGEKIKLTVRNVFYRGFVGKIKTVWYWLTIDKNRKLTFNEYLNLPVNYVMELPEGVNAYHDIDAEAELVKLLTEDINKQITKERRKYESSN